jgi:hypothetical protein
MLLLFYHLLCLPAGMLFYTATATNSNCPTHHHQNQSKQVTGTGTLLGGSHHR